MAPNAIPDHDPEARSLASQRNKAAVTRHVKARLKAAGLPAPKPEHLEEFFGLTLVQKALVLGDATVDPSARAAAVQKGDQHQLTSLVYQAALGDFFAERAAGAQAPLTAQGQDVASTLKSLIERHVRRAT